MNAKQSTILFLLLGGAVLTATIVPPSLWSFPQSLAFYQVVGAPPPGAQSLIIYNAAPGPASIKISTGAAWLAVSPTSGATPVTVSVGVNVTGLAAGTYHGSVIIASPDSRALEVPVTLTISSLGTPCPLVSQGR